MTSAKHPAAAASTAPGRIREIDALFADCASQGAPGAAVIVVKSGEIAHQACYGAADIERAIPLSPATKLHLGSASKHVCASALLIMQERNMLRLEDSIRAHVPELPACMAPITLRHLLNMTSGLFDGLNLPLFAGLPATGLAREKHLEILTRVDTLMFTPGTAQTYSNSNYLLISLAMERAYGATLPEIMDTLVFAPLGMSGTALAPDPQIIAGRAQGYAPDGTGGYRRAPDMSDLCADGGIITTLEDIRLWLAHLAHGRVGGVLLRDQLGETALLQGGLATSYGLGLTNVEALGRRKLSHAGGMPGFVADVAYFPDDDLGVVILANRLQASLIERTDKIAAALLKTPAPRSSAKIDALVRLLGVYVSKDFGGTAEFVREDDDVALHFMGERHVLVAAGENSFQGRKPGALCEISLRPGKAGARPALDLLWCGWRIALEPLDQAPAPAGDLSAYTGAYSSPLLGEVHHISLQNGRLHVGLDSALRSLLWRELKPRGGDLFNGLIEGEPSNTDVAIVFERDTNGDVTGFRYNLARTRALAFRRLP